MTVTEIADRVVNYIKENYLDIASEYLDDMDVRDPYMRGRPNVYILDGGRYAVELERKSASKYMFGKMYTKEEKIRFSSGYGRSTLYCFRIAQGDKGEVYVRCNPPLDGGIFETPDEAFYHLMDYVRGIVDFETEKFLDKFPEYREESEDDE